MSLQTGLPLHFCGPFLGKFADATMWKESGLPEFLEDQNLWVIGDKGYQGLFFIRRNNSNSNNNNNFINFQGCQRVKHCLKKKPGEEHLPEEKKDYNRRISKKRIKVENHFADLGKFDCLKKVFAGNVLNHSKALLCCECFLFWTKMNQ